MENKRQGRQDDGTVLLAQAYWPRQGRIVRFAMRCDALLRCAELRCSLSIRVMKCPSYLVSSGGMVSSIDWRRVRPRNTTEQSNKASMP